MCSFKLFFQTLQNNSDMTNADKQALAARMVTYDGSFTEIVPAELNGQNVTMQDIRLHLDTLRLSIWNQGTENMIESIPTSNVDVINRFSFKHIDAVIFMSFQKTRRSYYSRNRNNTLLYNVKFCKL